MWLFQKCPSILPGIKISEYPNITGEVLLYVIRQSIKEIIEFRVEGWIEHNSYKTIFCRINYSLKWKLYEKCVC